MTVLLQKDFICGCMWNLSNLHFRRVNLLSYKFSSYAFLLRLPKKKKVTLYIACVDLEKAFDKVSRYRLLSKLVARSIGYVMLEALKNIYLHTSCIIHFYGCFSDTFETMSGIRQGSASSVLLFILFMDGLFPFLRQHCSSEQLIK